MDKMVYPDNRTAAAGVEKDAYPTREENGMISSDDSKDFLDGLFNPVSKRTFGLFDIQQEFINVRVLTGSESIEEIEVNDFPYFIRIRDYFRLLDKGIIRENEFNRGGEPLDRKQINRMKDTLDIKGLPPFIVGHFKTFAKICDGHGRTHCLTESRDEGKLSEEQLDSFIKLEVIPEKDYLRRYLISHEQKGFAQRQKITDPSLHLGYFMRTIFLDIKIEGQIERKLINYISYIMYGCEQLPKEQWSFCDFKKFRQEVGNKSTVPYGESDFCLSEENRQDIVTAILFALDFRKHMDNEIRNNDKIDRAICSKISKSAPFFAAIVVDRMLPKERRLLTRSNDAQILCNQCIRNGSLIKPLLEGLSGKNAFFILTSISIALTQETKKSKKQESA